MDLLKRILKWVRISNIASTSGPYSKQQVTYNGKTADAITVSPYGIYANIPVGELALSGAVGGNSENRIIIGCVPSNVPKLSSGEVAVYHPESGAMIKLSADGSIEIKADTVTVTAGNANFTGDLIVDGDLAVGATMRDFLTHTHLYLPGPLPSAPTGPVILP